ncbi:uncharacterized protein LOC107841403 [Capsicum annuum]|uniref:uncharacterized protein LOC107841403 n=1 Tax=Capsicum annuum TaxID=4072 RepID=UPI001FB14C01|nr:uncharacterized protein LOC107841403 [Capsicum annuum]
MTRGRYHAGKSTVRSKATNRANIPSIPSPMIEQDDTCSIPTMPPDQTPLIPETSFISSNQSIPIGYNINAQRNTVAEATSSQRNISSSVDSSCSNVRTLIFLISSLLEPSSKCSSSITLSFKSEVDPNGINWKSVSQDKNFYWDASVSEVMVKQQWMKKAALCYKHFISDIKKHRATEVAAGTYTGRSITAGEHRKKLVLLVLCYFFSKQLLLFFLQAAAAKPFYFAAIFPTSFSVFFSVGGAKKKRLFGLGSEAASYFGIKLCTCNASTSSVPPSISIPTTNMEEFVKQLIPVLTTHFLPIVIKRVGGIRVHEGAVLDPPPTNDDDYDVDS